MGVIDLCGLRPYPVPSDRRRRNFVPDPPRTDPHRAPRLVLKPTTGRTDDASPRWLANSAGQPLVEHSVLVGRLAGHVVESRYREPGGALGTSPLLGRLATLARTAGYLHDVGKLDRPLADYLRSRHETADGIVDAEDDDDPEADPPVPDGDVPAAGSRPRHEEVGWLLLTTRFSRAALREHALWAERRTAPRHASALGTLEHALFWHHPRPVRTREQAARFDTAERIELVLRSRCRWLDEDAHADLARFLAELDRVADSRLSSTLLDEAEVESAAATETPPFKANYSIGARVTRTEHASAVAAEAERTLVRSALVTADRIVSGLGVDELLAHVAAGTLPALDDRPPGLDALHREIDSTIERFARVHRTGRTDEQRRAAAELAAVSDTGAVACLRGPAGCGKTKIALEWARRLDASRAGAHRRIVVLVPRTAVGAALFDELVRTYGLSSDVEYLSGATRRYHRAGSEAPVETPVELEGTGHLLITTIDQLCRALLSHQRIDWMTWLADADVIVDECHELLELPGIVLLFLETLWLRRRSRGATLLVSATPNPHFLAMLGVEAHDVVDVPSFNRKPYRLVVHRLPGSAYDAHGRASGEHPFVSGALAQACDSGQVSGPGPTPAPGLAPTPGTFVLCNTAGLAQRASVVHVDAGHEVLCLHSRYTPRDRLALLDDALRAFGPEAPAPTRLLVAGPIVQASLNISTDHLHLEACHAEGFLQRIGRCNRFAASDAATIELHVCRRAADGRLGDGVLLGHLGQHARTEAFVGYLLEWLDAHASSTQTSPTHASSTYASPTHASSKHAASSDDGTELETRLTLDALYRLYDDYHGTPAAREAHGRDLDVLLERSHALFADAAFDPVRQRRRRPGRARRDRAPRLAARTLRGTSYYVLPLVLDVDAGDGPAQLSLLWTDASPAADRLTDALHRAERHTGLQAIYVALSNAAHRCPAAGTRATSEAEAAFLRRLGRRTRSIRDWHVLRARARDPDTPILVAGEHHDEAHLYYVRHRGTPLGLVAVDTYDSVARRSMGELVDRATAPDARADVVVEPEA